ncbi:MAG: hypothetical protein HC893_04640 [Chloroflexaceae bacterium]|nr:hypothetical protein [Chloroflexaceae bacterium]
MTSTRQTAVMDTAPTSLIASSKEKYRLCQARLNRGWIELALLSIHGSLEDGLRSYLLLRHLPAPQGEWDALLRQIQTHGELAEADQSTARLYQIDHLHRCITRGEAVYDCCRNNAGIPARGCRGAQSTRRVGGGARRAQHNSGRYQSGALVDEWRATYAPQHTDTGGSAGAGGGAGAWCSGNQPYACYGQPARYSAGRRITNALEHPAARHC